MTQNNMLGYSNHMKAIRVTYANGNVTETDINGTDAEIRAYYLGQWFNMGQGDGPDVMVQATRVEFLNPDGTVRPLDPIKLVLEAEQMRHADAVKRAPRPQEEWDGAIVLEAVLYRLKCCDFGPSTVAQMPRFTDACPACGSDRRDVCEVIGHVYPI